MPILAAFVVVCAVSSLASTLLAGRLWGWTIAGLMTALNFEWIQRSLLGGSEPLFMLLLLGCFLCVRRGRWRTASLLASLATTVRPLGICALFAIGLVLLARREYRQFAFAFCTGLIIGTLYMLPLHFYLNDSLATVHSYESTRALFGLPFVAILQGVFYYHPPLTNLTLSGSWILLIIAGLALLIVLRNCGEYRRSHPVEFIFALLYTSTICCYNYPHWALGNFARFSIPAIPFALIGWRGLVRVVHEKAMQSPAISRLQRMRVAIGGLRAESMVWACAVIFPALAACSAYGIRNILR